MRSKAINVNQMAGHCDITPLLAAGGGRILQEELELDWRKGKAEPSNSVASSPHFALTMHSDCALEAMEGCKVLPKVCGFTTAVLCD